MVRGGPDWGLDRGSPRLLREEMDTGLWQGQGLESQAALGAGAGRLLFKTTFYPSGVNELVWKSIVGAGAQIAVDTTLSQYNQYSAKLTHGSAVNNTTQFMRADGRLSSNGRYGNLASLFIPATFTTGRFGLFIDVVTGSTIFDHFEVWLNWAPDATYNAMANLLYTDSLGALIDVPGGQTVPLTLGRGWHHLELIANRTGAGQLSYIDRLEFNHQQFSLNTPSQQLSGLGFGFGIHFGAKLVAQVASNQALNIGSWILTEDEP